jgi:hypothetical protein
MAAINYRKNIDCLTTDELHELREALAEMYTLPATHSNSFAKQATFHGGPPIAYCRHGAPGFFTWHRAEMKAFEDALQAVGCKVMLPFWDWSSGPSTGIPAACRDATYVNRAGDTVPNPLYAGPRNGGGWTNRSAAIDSVSFSDLATSVQAALSEPTFSSFQSLINGPHGSVHVRVSGDMCCVPTASYDPIFYLHHANVDRIWARWQTTHPGPLPAAEADWQLPPFNRPFSTEWQRGSDVVSTDELGYRYRTFCFYLPPIRIWEVIAIPWLPEVRERFTTARLVVRSERMQEQAVEVRVFLNQPRASARTKTIGNPAFAGAFGFIGHGSEAETGSLHCAECALVGHTHEHAHHDRGVSTAPHGHDVGHDHGSHDHGDGNGHGAVSNERFDVELDLSANLRALAAEDDEVALKLVAVDADGNEVSAENFNADEIELAIE